MHLSTGQKQAQHRISSQPQNLLVQVFRFPLSQQEQKLWMQHRQELSVEPSVETRLPVQPALAVMDIMKRDDYAGKARHIGEVVMKRYKELQEKYPVIGDVQWTWRYDRY